jgi:hypothetical protein
MREHNPSNPLRVQISHSLALMIHVNPEAGEKTQACKSGLEADFGCGLAAGDRNLPGPTRANGAANLLKSLRSPSVHATSTEKAARVEDSGYTLDLGIHVRTGLPMPRLEHP